MIGTSIGKYRIVDQLGRGGTGTVYRATDTSLGRDVALKVLDADLQHSSVIAGFLTDAVALAKLDHHELATIYEVDTVDSHLLVVMELARGQSFEQVAQRSGPMPPERAGHLVWQVLGALAHAHQAGIVHGDINPSNLLVTDGAGIKIIDFGLARIAEAEQETTDATQAGTPVYKAPEQVLSQDVDSRADLYACGVVFYQLLTGTLPFKATRPAELLQQVVHDPPASLSTSRPDLPHWCDTVIARALAKSPGDRFQSAEEFRDELMMGLGNAASSATRAFVVPAIAGPPPALADAKTVMLPAYTEPKTQIVPPHERAQAVAPPPPPPLPPVAAPLQAPDAPAGNAPPSKVPPAATKAKNNQHLAASVAIAAVAGVLVAYFIARAANAPEPSIVEPAPAATAPAVPEPAPAVSDTASAAATTTPPAPEPVVPPGSSPAIVPAPPAKKAPAKKTSPAPLSTADSSPTREVVPAAPAAVVDEPKAAPAPVFPAMTFEADAVVADRDRHRERDARVTLADGKITITERNNRAIATLAFDAITGISYSTSRHPQWNSPAGPSDVLKVEGGAFGIRRAGRNWLALRAGDTLQVIRVRDADVRRVIEALETRTGRAVDRVPEEKD